MKKDMAEHWAYMMRDRKTVSSKEFGAELTTIFKILFPDANEKAKAEMEMVGQALGVWLELLIDSRIKELMK